VHVALLQSVQFTVQIACILYTPTGGLYIKRIIQNAFIACLLAVERTTSCCIAISDAAPSAVFSLSLENAVLTHFRTFHFLVAMHKMMHIYLQVTLQSDYLRPVILTRF